jgi:hypothetical protein
MGEPSLSGGCSDKYDCNPGEECVLKSEAGKYKDRGFCQSPTTSPTPTPTPTPGPGGSRGGNLKLGDDAGGPGNNTELYRNLFIGSISAFGVMLLIVLFLLYRSSRGGNLAFRRCRK